MFDRGGGAMAKRVKGGEKQASKEGRVRTGARGREEGEREVKYELHILCQGQLVVIALSVHGVV